LLLSILSLGVAISVSVFSLVDGILLRPLPYRDSSRLVSIEAIATKPPFDSNGSFSYADYEQFRAQAHSFSDIAVTYREGWSRAVLTEGGRETFRADLFRQVSSSSSAALRSSAASLAPRKAKPASMSS